ncbi:UTP--glucose-1-phosphate uridylyltransferase [hydrothermal vent metagenome]|uniref:UTP--glucose-1-phosphate uridylyltransferase n=1 Tax=hydrothermal vent metagenome TaxID=652676 RepID=A0A3B0R6A5_9ZZZZ
MKIKKAVFPSAGMGTRFLPATKAIPKEMLPLVDKPLIQYCVEEAHKSGIEEIIFITGRGKRAIEDHFDVSFELETTLKEKKKTAILNKIRHISEDLTYIYTRQKKALGLGHAVLCAKNIVNNEPFAVFLGDDIIDAKVPAMKQMIKVFGKYQASILAVQRVPKKHTHMYGIIKGKKIGDGLYKVEDVVEKPEKNPPSNLAIIGRYILTPEIFTQLEKNKKGSGGEYQLTDAIKGLLKTQAVYAYEFDGERFDAGDKVGFLKANIYMGLKNKETAKELKKFIKGLL